MLPARLIAISRNLPYQLVRNLSCTPVRKMPFVKHEVVPDVIPVAPKAIAKVDYVSGGNYSIFSEKCHFRLTFAYFEVVLFLLLILSPYI